MACFRATEATWAAPKFCGPGICDSPADEEVGAEGGRHWLRELGLRHAPGAFGGSDNRIHPEAPPGSNAPVEVLEPLFRDRQGSFGIPSAKELTDGTCIQA